MKIGKSINVVRIKGSIPYHSGRCSRESTFHCSGWRSGRRRVAGKEGMEGALSAPAFKIIMFDSVSQFLIRTLWVIRGSKNKFVSSTRLMTHPYYFLIRKYMRTSRLFKVSTSLIIQPFASSIRNATMMRYARDLSDPTHYESLCHVNKSISLRIAPASTHAKFQASNIGCLKNPKIQTPCVHVYWSCSVIWTKK